MYAVSDTFLAALRNPHSVVVTVEAWRSGSLVASDLPVEGGQVTVDSGSRVRRKLDLTLAPETALWDTLAPVGTELRVRRGIRYPNGETETVPLGVFDVDVQRLGYTPGGRLALTAPDRWVRVQRAQFETPTKPTAGTRISAEIARLVTQAVNVTPSNTASSTVNVPAVIWERDRDEAIGQLGKSIGAEAFFNPDGNVVIRDVPTLANPAVWLVDASASGVLLAADRERNRQRTYNVVIVASDRTDGQAPFAPQTVADNDTTSPTYVGGPFGRVPYFFTSPLLTSAAQATAAGTTLLNRVRGLAAQLALESVVNPALDGGDVINVLLPPERADLPRPVERHIIDALTVPLTVDGTQSITTRSTRPDEAEGS